MRMMRREMEMMKAEIRCLYHGGYEARVRAKLGPDCTFFLL